METTPTLRVTSGRMNPESVIYDLVPIDRLALGLPREPKLNPWPGSEPWAIEAPGAGKTSTIRG
jgi:hypothetical protein